MTNDIYIIIIFCLKIIIVCFTRVILLCHLGKGPIPTVLVSLGCYVRLVNNSVSLPSPRCIGKGMVVCMFVCVCDTLFLCQCNIM